MLMSGGAKENGSSMETIAYVITMSGGAKENGSAKLESEPLYFCQSTNTYTTCNSLSTVNRDLATSVGSGTTSFTTTSVTYVRVGTYKINFVGASGTYKTSLNITAATGTYRFRLEILDSSCAIVANGSYSADLTTTGVKTLTDVITWPGTGATIAIRIDVKKTGGVGPTGCVVTQDSSSYVQVVLP
jgi:hypothetical protein